MTPMTFMQLATKVLASAASPMSVDEIWLSANQMGYVTLLNSAGKTPGATLAAQLYASVKHDKTTPFAAIGERPKRFYLKANAATMTFPSEADLGGPDELPPQDFLEKHLHGHLAYFANKVLGVHCKTINHSKTSKKEFAEWLHPDVVGCYFPMERWSKHAVELSEAIGSTGIRLYSFELKRRLDFSTLRASFFQAVSNSSWAHEGYLCAAEILEDGEFREELERLSGSFGIGVIRIDFQNPDGSEVLIPSRLKQDLDWEGVNKLCISPDFCTFIERVKKDLQSKEVRKEQYDKVTSTEELMKFSKGLQKP